ncbi:MAG: hypothetical protein JNM60_06070 [Candidatus Competibacteraceae bacterium]|nr:hypothetical protein [Candidatus Competibacteraceae bacterium]
MTIWQVSSWLVLVGVALLIAMAGWLLLRFSQSRKRAAEQRTLAFRQAAAAARAAVQSEAEARLAAESEAAARTAAERLAAKRAAVERAALERAIQEKSALEQAITEWAAAEQAESERVQLHRTHADQHESEQMEARMQAVEEAIAEWLTAEQAGHRLSAAVAPASGSKKGYTRTEAIHQQIRLTAERVDKEAQDLDFIKNRIETGVDFLPLEFKQTIEEWKKGQMLRHTTFDDLKLKFRYKAYSIEDGYELLYRYSDWLVQQRQKLRVFIRLLGTSVEEKESIQAAIERAEQNEREKYLEMNVDVIFALHDVRVVLGKLIGMETILNELEIVCRKRSEQIIAPSWEAKGSL